MRLQFKLTLAFTAVALLPILLLAAVARVVIANRYRSEFRSELEADEAVTRRELRRFALELEDGARRLGKSTNPLLGPLLVALSRGPLEDDAARELAARAETEMRTLGLDVLEIVDARGEVLAAPHYPGRVGEIDQGALGRARAHGGRADLYEEELVAEGRVRNVLVMSAAREVEAPFGAKVALVVGRTLERGLFPHLPRGAHLFDPDGRLRYGPEVRSTERDYPRSSVVLERGDGSRAGVVEIVVSDDVLHQTLELITWATVGLCLGGLALAVLFGAILARRFSLPLSALVEGANEVARGQLGVSVPVRGRDEIGVLGEAFNAMVRDLKLARDQLGRAERIAAWREVAQRIAHEIKNPLTPIQMAIETLERARKRDLATFESLFSESAATILDEVARLKHIVGEFSRFARLPAPVFAPCSLNEVVEAALTLYAAGSAPISRSLAPELPAISADRDQLTQVLLNLLENAREAVLASGKGEIRVTTRAHPTSAERVELEVADTGPGLSDAARARLFVPYFTTKPRGTGLGLAIVYRIVTDHGGVIAVDSMPGVGTTFTIVLGSPERGTPA